MEIWLLSILLFGSMLIVLFLGLPIAFALGGVAVIFILWQWGPVGLLTVALTAYPELTSYILIAVPLFVFMAVILEGSGIAEDLYGVMYQWLGGIPGGLAMGTVVICMVFAAMAGISGVAVVTMGLIAMPSMLARGYDRKMITGTVCIGGALGIIIPPSVVAIFYGSLTGESVGKLFAGGIIPGVIIGVIMMIYIAIKCIRDPKAGPPISKEERVTTRHKFVALRALAAPIVIITLVLGTIYMGVCTPTEASGIGAFCSLMVALAYRRLNWEKIKLACYRTLNITAMVLALIIGAKCFAQVYSYVGAADFMLSLVTAVEIPPLAVVGIMMLILFFLGMFIDPGGMMMICVPVFVPIILALGFDPIWFGVLVIINCGCAYVTPPFGFNLFYMRVLCPPDMSVGEIYRAIIPFVVCELIGMVLLLFFPNLALLLPNMMIKG